jgi:hypothetical protein
MTTSPDLRESAENHALSLEKWRRSPAGEFCALQHDAIRMMIEASREDA